MGIADAGNDPTTLTTRRAYDLLSSGFAAAPTAKTAPCHPKADRRWSITGMGCAHLTPLCVSDTAPDSSHDATITLDVGKPFTADVDRPELVEQLINNEA